MLLMSLATLLALDLQVLMCCPKPLPLVITSSSAKVGSSQGNTWGVTAPDVKRHIGNFEPAKTVKSVPLDPSNDASKQIRIDSKLDPN